MYDYHDATFKSAIIDWADAKLEMNFALCSSPVQSVVVKATGLLRFHCPRRIPWGESVSVNEVRTNLENSDFERWEIEMQSGDILEVEANKIEEENE